MKRGALIAGGVALLGSGVAMLLMSRRTTKAVEDAVSGAGSPKVTLHLTHYWPFKKGMTDAQKLMEGKPEDATGAPLHTVEDFLSGKSDYVSLAGDLQGHKGTLWPYGQKLLIPWGDRTLVGRVVDTGGHFHGKNKVYRVMGAEPIDVCVFSSDNHPPKSTVDAVVVVGDTFAKAGAVAKLDQAGKPALVGLDVFSTRSA